MINLQNLISFVNIFREESAHFLFSGALGLLAYWLTWTILRAFLRLFIPVISMRYMVISHYMSIIPLLVGLSFALLGHYWLDAFWVWYTTPLGPKLIIID